MSAQAGDEIGGYLLERMLASGSLAEVWLAHPLAPTASMGRVAFKRLNPDLASDETLREVFLHEARQAQQVEHPNVVRVVDCGTAHGTCFIAMEYIDGVDLGAALDANGGPLRPALAVAMVADACKGLAAAHKRGVLHRDVSLPNVMVDTHGSVRLVDFGISRADPMRRAGPPAGPASDVHALALALQALVEGQSPGGIPEGLVDVFDKAVGGAPADRFATAGEFEAALRAYLVGAQAPSAGEVGRQVLAWQQKVPKLVVVPAAAAAPRPVAPKPVAPPPAAPIAAAARPKPSAPVAKARESSSGPRAAPAFANLETFGVPSPSSPGGPPKVLVTHPKDEAKTQPLSLEDKPGSAEWDTDTDPQNRAPLASVMLDPELEKVAVRQHSTGKKKSKKPKK